MKTQGHDVDCVIVGYNDVGFASVENQMKAVQRHSGGYRALKSDSVILHGRRMPYMDLLNHVLTAATGQPSRLHVTELPNLGACYLANYLGKRGFKAEIVNSFNHDQNRLCELLRAAPRAVAIMTTLYVDHAPIVEIVDFVRWHNPDVPIIVGGPHIFNLCSVHDPATLDYLLDLIGADIYVFDSQGEDALASILRSLRDPGALDLGDVPNLLYRRDGKLCRSPRVPEANNMDENVIDWRAFDPDFLGSAVQMRTARSCAFKCAFCSYPGMAGPLSLMSPHVVEQEVRQLAELGVETIVFIDDTFNVPLPRFKTLCRILQEYNLRWFSYFRCSNADEECFALMEKSGCAGVFLGIESGDQRILNNMNKHARVEKYVHGIHELNARGIITFASLIVGFPGETAESVETTMAFIEEAQPVYYRAELYYHNVAARVPIQDRASDYGLIGGGYSWKHNSMDWQEACDLVELMYRQVRGPVVLPSYMFNFWAIPYVLSKITSDQLHGFSRAAQELLVRSLDDASGACDDIEERLVQVFS